MNTKTLIQGHLLCFVIICFISCSGVSDKKSEIIGIWESDLIDSPDLGLITYTILFGENRKYELHIKLDTGETLSFSGKFTLEKDILLLHTTLGYGLEDGKKVYTEEIDINQKYHILKLDSDKLVLKMLNYDINEDILEFKRKGL